MSAIFKVRKVPKHLVIEDDAKFDRRPRFNLLKFLLWTVVVLVVTGVLLVGVDLGVGMLEPAP